MISVCYVLAYRDPDYIRTRTLILALQKIESITLIQARNSSKGLWRYFQTLWKLIIIRITINPEYYLLGFRGYELFWPVRIVTIGKHLIYDHMMSPYDSLLNERKSIRKNSLLDKLVYHYEKSILENADLILTDTESHRSFFSELFNIPSKKIIEVPVGTYEELFNSRSQLDFPRSDHFEVLFYGSYLPLHGVDIILGAASRLKGYPIHFTLVGGNQINPYFQAIKQANLANINQLEWVEFDKLPELISQSNIGLGGPFGNTGQSHRVITTKTFQFLAMGKPVIIGENAGGYGFEDKMNCLVVPQGDEIVLANAILWAFNHCDKIEQIGLRGNELYQNRYSIKQISKKLEWIILREI